MWNKTGAILIPAVVLAMAMCSCASAQKAIYGYRAFYKQSLPGVNNSNKIEPFDGTDGKQKKQSGAVGNIDTVYLIYLQTKTTQAPEIDSVIIGAKVYRTTLEKLPAEKDIGVEKATAKTVSLSQGSGKVWWQVGLSLLPSPSPAIAKPKSFKLYGRFKAKPFQIDLIPIELEPDVRM